jgi:PAS domain S-box-containing protein
MKIANKISLSFLAVGLILTSIAASFFYLIAKDDLQKAIYNNLATACCFRSDHIKTYLQMLEISVGQLSKSVVLENYLLINGKENPKQGEAFEQAMKRLKRTKEANSAISEFMLLDKTGKVVASSNESSIGLDYSTDDLFLGAQKGIYIKDAYFSETKKMPLMAVSAPLLYSQTLEFLGVLVSRVSLTDLNNIASSETGMSKTGEIYIVDKLGYMITPSRFKEDAVLKQRVDTENVRQARLDKDVEHVLFQHKLAGVFPNYLGAQVLGAHEYIPQMEWTVLAEIEVKEAFASLAKLRLVFSLILFIVPIAAWLLGTILAKLIIGSLHKLHKGTEIIGSGNLDYKVGTDARDEVGQLSRAFDQMTRGLKETTTSIDSLNKEIAERKLVEEALKSSEGRFKAIFNTTFQFTGLMTLDGILIEANQAAVNFIGLRLEDVINRPFWETHWWRGNAERVQKLKESICLAASGKFIRYEVELQGAGDTTAIFDFSIKPAFGLDGKMNFLVPEGRDITERKKAEEMLIEAMKVKSDFTSTVSHELRTPLTAIKEGIAIVLDGTTGALNAEQKDFLSLAKRNVDRLARLINDVLDFQKLEAQKMVFNIQENDINALVREVHNTMAPLTGKKGLGFLLQLEEGLPQVKFDRDRIVQVLTNLVNNAIKFTENGSIVIATKCGDNVIQVAVKDSGPGVKVEDMGKLFQQFRQLEKITERKTGGTGLGLAISKEIIERHKGKIWAESEFGKGTTFWFSLPVKAKDKVLVIDDDKVILDIIKNLLEKKGYGVTCSEKGWDAIEIIGRDKPDLVILDMILKDISGFEIIGRLRSNKDTLKVPIIAMSGHPEELIKIEDRQEELVLVSISKPFDLENLSSIARKLLQQRF